MVKDIAVLYLLLDEVKNKFGKPIVINSDFQALSNSILSVTGSYISPSTLKRYYGHKDPKDNSLHNCHASMLNILAAYIDYPSYEAFEQKEKQTPTKTSHTFANKRFESAKLAPGQLLSLTWAPDRKVIIRHNTADHFTIIESFNSKLNCGDTFEVSHIINKCPLMLINLRQGTNPPTDYICAQNYSLKAELID